MYERGRRPRFKEKPCLAGEFVSPCRERNYEGDIVGMQCLSLTPIQVTIPVPCVVYLHGNSGSRIDADDVVDSFLVEQVSSEYLFYSQPVASRWQSSRLTLVAAACRMET